MRNKELKVFVLLMFCITGGIGQLSSQQDSDYDYDPQLSFLKLFSIFEQKNVTIPNIRIPDVTTTTSSSAPTQQQQQHQQQPKVEVITIPDLSRSVGISLQDNEVMAQPSSPPPVQTIYEWFPARRSASQTQTSSEISTPCSQSQIQPSFARSAIPIEPAAPETVGNQQRANFGSLLQQPQPQYTVAATSNSALMVQDANAPVAPIPIYDRIQFPCFAKSSATTSAFPLPDATQQTSSNLVFDCGCKPLEMGDACLQPLLQSTSFFYSALKNTGIMDYICDYPTLTILAPTNRSFAQLAYELEIIPEDLLLPQNKQVFLQILRLHIFIGEQLSPERLLQRSTLVPEELTSWLGQFVTAKTDIEDNTVTFRPPIMLAPPAYVQFINSGQDVFLQQDCKVDYYYVVQNVLIPHFI